MYEPVSHGPIVRATLAELDLLLTEADYQFGVLTRYDTLSTDLVAARGAVALALAVIRDEAQEERLASGTVTPIK